VVKPRARDKNRAKPVSRRREKRRPAPATSETGKTLREVFEAEDFGLTTAQYVVAVTWLGNGFQGADAYREAHPGCSNDTARVEASRTLALPNVRAFLRARFDQWLGPLEMSAEEAIRRIGSMAQADVRVLYKDGKLLPVNEWPAWMVPAIKKVEEKGVTLVDPLAAANKVLELEGRLKSPAGQAADVLGEALKETWRLAREAEAKKGDA